MVYNDNMVFCIKRNLFFLMHLNSLIKCCRKGGHVFLHAVLNTYDRIL